MITPFTIDPRTSKPLNGPVAGLTGSISWRRLCREAFRESNEIKPNETVTSITASEHGLTFTIETQRTKPTAEQSS